jgi:PAS domain S-box-containing protein
MEASISLAETDETKLFTVIIRDVTEEVRAEHALRESEQKFRRLIEHIGEALAVDDAHGRVVFANDQFLDMFGFRRDEIGRIGVEDYAAPEYRTALRDRHDRRMHGEEQPSQYEYEGVRRDGTRVWVDANVVVIRDSDGKAVGSQKILRDVTDRKRAEQLIHDATASIGRRLIEAHEEERTRIGRELHDDINQRLALLAVELDRWTEGLPFSPELRELITHAQHRITDIARDVQSLSHRLHSSKLDYLGLATAANSFCRELSEKSDVRVKFSHAGVPRTIPKEISLCLFRVLQEALQNALKHSGVREFTVNLRGTSEAIELTVTDSGSGFDENEAFTRQGLGLISMRERLQLVHGELSVESRRGAGTTIRARAPLARNESEAMAS